MKCSTGELEGPAILSVQWASRVRCVWSTTFLLAFVRLHSFNCIFLGDILICFLLGPLDLLCFVLKLQCIANNCRTNRSTINITQSTNQTQQSIINCKTNQHNTDLAHEGGATDISDLSCNMRQQKTESQRDIWNIISPSLAHQTFFAFIHLFQHLLLFFLSFLSWGQQCS